MPIPKSSFLAALAIATAVAVAGGERAPHARLDLLAKGSVEVGHVCYEQIARAVYGGQLEEIIEKKRVWRHAHPEQPWLSDYDLLLKIAVNVEATSGRHDCHAPKGILARYSLETNTARIPRGSSGAILAHEVAHGLTRRSVRTAEQQSQVDMRLNLVAVAPPDSAFARESGFHLEWLTYVSSQVEFEVRLQALNRYHFEVTGRVIDSPAEALRAVASLGASLDPRVVARVLAGVGDPEAGLSAHALFATSHRIWSEVPECFRNADDLRKALQMAAAWDPEIRSTLLEKIAWEAPGHF